MRRNSLLILAALLVAAGVAYVAHVEATEAPGTAYYAGVTNKTGYSVNITFTSWKISQSKNLTTTKAIGNNSNYSFTCADQENPIKLEGTITVGGAAKTIKSTCINPAHSTCSSGGYAINSSWEVKRVTGTGATVNNNDYQFVIYP